MKFQTVNIVKLPNNSIMVTFSGVDLPSNQDRNRNVQRRKKMKKLKNKKATKLQERVKEGQKKKKNNVEWMQPFIDCTFPLLQRNDLKMDLFLELIQFFTEYVLIQFHISI